MRRFRAKQKVNDDRGAPHAKKRKNGGSYFQGLAPITGVTLLHREKRARHQRRDDDFDYDDEE